VLVFAPGAPTLQDLCGRSSTERLIRNDDGTAKLLRKASPLAAITIRPPASAIIQIEQDWRGASDELPEELKARDFRQISPQVDSTVWSIWKT
jgi:hypothetical protein